MTPRELDTLRWIYAYIVEWRWSPSVREVAAGLGVGTAQAHKLMTSLIRQGYLDRGPARSALQLRISRRSIVEARDLQLRQLVPPVD